MARLDWNAAGERFYETGVDRGVLYLDGLGYAWPGLVSVNESPTGGEARPYYIDGVKYLNLQTMEEFEAEITAIYSPPQFALCDGIRGVHMGLFVTQQARKTFGFSYRTKLGNDIEGTEYGYKIHLVYNALAAPSERTNQTLSDSVEVEPRSWSITTLAPALAGYRPTAHFVIDSRLSSPDNLLELEDMLYGSDTGRSAMPTVEQLIGIFDDSYTYDGGSPDDNATVIFDGGIV